jgi:predicted AAA+ superfamily ATPase
MQIVFSVNENYLRYYFIAGGNPWASSWTKDQTKDMMFEQFESFRDLDTRIIQTQLFQIESAKNIPHAGTVSRPRRVGKSTLLAQMAHRLGSDQFYYVNFDASLIGWSACF